MMHHNARFSLMLDRRRIVDLFGVQATFKLPQNRVIWCSSFCSWVDMAILAISRQTLDIPFSPDFRLCLKVGIGIRKVSG